MGLPEFVEFIVAPTANVFILLTMPEIITQRFFHPLLMARTKRKQRRNHRDRSDPRSGMIRTLGDRPPCTHPRPFPKSFASLPLSHALARCWQAADVAGP